MECLYLIPFTSRDATANVYIVRTSGNETPAEILNGARRALTSFTTEQSPAAMLAHCAD